MNDTTQASPCTCKACPGASCRCGCQTVPSQTGTPAACACGPQCPCGPACTCAKS